MERKFYTDNFEQLLKEKSDEFRMYPSKRVWHSIYNDLHPGRKWPSIAVSMLLIISLLMVSYWNSNKASKTAFASNVVSPNNATTTIITPQQNIFLSPNNNQTPLPASVTNSTNTKALADYKNLNNSSINPAGITNSKISNTYTASKAENKLNGKNDYVFAKEKNIIQPADNIAKTNVAQQKEDNAVAVTALDVIVKNNEEELTEGNENSIEGKSYNAIPTASITQNLVSNLKNAMPLNNNEDKNLKVNLFTDIKTISADDKAWMEAYAFNNKPKRKKWQDRTAIEFYITPNIGYRNISNNSIYNTAISNPLILASNNAGNLNDELNHKPGLGLEAGVGLVYSLAKNIRVKAGVQANYTNYVINADETDHPIVTTLLFNNLINGFPYMETRSSTLANNTGFKTVKVHNKTYQISIPVGIAVKVTGNQKLEWYAGATIQPTLVIGGKANLISADRRNYVSDPSLMRRWGLNSGFETYIHYKFAGYTLQAGPQFRYQLVSTYSQKYSLKENLYNAGLKIGVIKNL